MLDYTIHYCKWHDGSKAHYDQMSVFYRNLLGDAVLASIPKQAHILDVGCGQGLLVYALLAYGFQDVQGIDLSERQVSVALGQGLPCSAVAGEYIHSLAGTSPGKYDVIFFMDVLEHLAKDEQVRILHSMSCLLSPGGKLILSVPNANASFGLRWRYIDWTHESSFTEHSLEFLLLNSSFKDLTFLPYEFQTQPRLVFIPRKAVFFWALHRFFRLMRRLEAVSELGADGWRIPLSLNLLVQCVKTDA